MTDFYMVSFDKNPYYDRTAFLLIIAFTFVPFINFGSMFLLYYFSDKYGPKIIEYLFEK